VFTQDRVGLLFTITHTLFELGMKIHLARISTNADQALDVFYISDREGNKVTDLERMRTIKAALIERLEGKPVTETASALTQLDEAPQGG
jgi:[protein-PII] uridylyltransferase